MSTERFVYVTYIRTTPEALWAALTEPEFTRRYWSGYWPDTSWEVGSPWRLTGPEGKVADLGEVLEFDPPRRLAVSWLHQLREELKAEGASRASFDLEPHGDMVKLTVIHEIDKTGSKLIAAVSTGWPMILSSLKSLLETGGSMSEPVVGR